MLSLRLRGYPPTAGIARYVLTLCLCLTASNLISQEREARTQRREPDKAVEASNEKVFSGPQAGESLGDVPVWIVQADEKPSVQKDLAKLSEDSPIAIAFMHQRERPAFYLCRLMGLYAERLKEKKLQLFVVVLTDDRSGSETWLRNIRRNFSSSTQLAVADGGIEGPGALGLNRLVTLSILIAKDGKVTDNFALTQVSTEVDGPKVLKAMSDVVDGGKVPPVDELIPATRRR